MSEIKFFQITLKFVKWHICLDSGVSNRTMPWSSRFCFLWELCETRGHGQLRLSRYESDDNYTIAMTKLINIFID